MIVWNLNHESLWNINKVYIFNDILIINQNCVPFFQVIYYFKLISIKNHSKVTPLWISSLWRTICILFRIVRLPNLIILEYFEPLSIALLIKFKRKPYSSKCSFFISMLTNFFYFSSAHVRHNVKNYFLFMCGGRTGIFKPFSDKILHLIRAKYLQLGLKFSVIIRESKYIKVELKYIICSLGLQL